MSLQKTHKASFYGWLLLSATFGASTAQAAIDISTAPLETGTAVPPNIMFIIDDSGSMRWGFMPDDLSSSFNLGSNCDSSSTTYAGATVKKCKATGRKYLASSHLNKVYYNPKTTYLVPLKPDGVTYYNTPSYNNAPDDGFDSSSGKVDLRTDYRALIADYNYPNSSTGFTISSSTSSTSTSEAFYFEFNNDSGCASSPRSDSCYDLVKMSSESAAQRQNFANWFAFYRTRLMSSKSGVSAAFQTQGDTIRVGYGSLNTSGVIGSNVGNFSGSGRSGFFTWLHNKSASGGTPLIGALNAAGKYFTKDEPWRTNPASSSSALLECRQNFTILMTDGYYSDSISGVNDQDSTDGATITGPKSKSYTYKAANPFKDGKGNTLADVAMKYWKNDLRTDLDNTVPFSGGNPAFWQHMVTFGVGLGVTGSVTTKAGFDAITSGAAISWWTGSSAENKINDLLHAGVNSRGGFFSADNPSVFADGLAATLNAIQERVGSASNIAATAINSLQTESNLFQARYIAGQWAGDLWSYDVNDISTPVWKASEKMPAAGSRNILVGNGSTKGRNFTWSNLTPAEKTALGGAASIVDYLRGDISQEKLKGGVYRDRISPLGDLVNSSPELVGEPIDMSYHRFSWAGAADYRSFLSGPVKTRTPMIYVGGNDGMVHGFNSKTGVEVFAFIPSSVMAPISGSDNVLKKYSEPTYNHRFSVDGSPTVADVYIDGNWKSILVGGLGRGGNSLYAIDVTNPSNIDGNSVLWDKSFAEMGVYLGKPQIFRMESGDWAILVGYGINNSTNKSGLLVIDIKNGNILAKLPTTAGSAGDPNGISEINVLDIDADGSIDWVYGGDLHGYVWKFDLSAASTSSWTIANSGQALFQAKDPGGTRQMITGGVMSSIDPKTGKSWVFFGTGRYLNQDDPSNTQTQTWYGIIDGPTISSRSELVPRVMTKVGEDRVVTAANELDPGKKGWYMDLIDNRERIVDLPVVIGGDLVMNTMIPDTNVCNPSGSGYVMAVSPYVGGRLKKTFFDTSDDEKFTADDKVKVGTEMVEVSGIKVGSLNSVVTFTKKGDKVVALVNCENANVCEEPANVNQNTGLQSWHEISN
ncbi:MAG: pilus assembly protein PilY [Gammaproteobacteria bacterium]|nr:pilus assembly protein PilY [Gammaproteobacteria bacterium]